MHLLGKFMDGAARMLRCSSTGESKKEGFVAGHITI